MTAVENVSFNLLPFPFPNSYVKNLAVAPLIESFKNPNIAITPPTALEMPKSSTPNVANTTLDVYNETNMLNSILPYSMSVFFAMRLVFSAWFCILTMYSTSQKS